MSFRTLLEFLHHRRVLLQTAFVVMVTATYMWLIQDQSSWVSDFEYSVLNLRMQLWPPREAPKNIVILAVYDSSFHRNATIDEAAKALAVTPELRFLVDEWPWNREFWAQLTNRLMGAGARFVAYDFVFNGQIKDELTDGLTGDKDCGLVFQKYADRLAIASQLGETHPGSNEMIIEPESSLVMNPDSDLVGVAKLNAGMVRTIQHHYDLSPLENIERARAPDQPHKRHSEYSLSWVTAKKILGSSPQRDPDQPMLLNFYPVWDETTNASFETLSLVDVLFEWDAKYQHGKYFKDKIVFVGPYAETRFADIYTTPVNPFMPGVDIQATSFANLIHSDWLVPAPDWIVLLLALGLGALALGVSLYVHSVVLKIGLFTSLGAVFLVASQLLFWSHLYVIPVAGAAIILVSCGAFGTLYDYILTQYERQRMLGMFESMVSPGVAGLLLSQRGDFEKRLAGQRQEVVILFGDIRNFTSWSEKVGPEALVAQMNEHLSAMVDIVQDEGGTVQKYIGDALMAAWGDVRAQPPAENAAHAVRAALRMQQVLHKLNTRWADQPGREQLSFGIGINHGEGVVGCIGHPRRQEFTVMGDPVNIAARLESATKHYHQPILVGPNVYEMTKELFIYRLVDKMRVRGKSLAVRVYTPLSELTTAPPPGLATYNAALEKYYARDFAGAAELFHTALAQMGGDDFICRNFLERCEHYLTKPPPPNWNGDWTLTEK